MEITRPSIVRLSRKAGIKSLGDDSFQLIREIAEQKTEEIIRKALVMCSEKGTKTLMEEDIYDVLGLLGCNLTKSTELGTTIMEK
jgi:histone H3/H4